MKCYTDIHGFHRMNHNDFGDCLNFLLALPDCADMVPSQMMHPITFLDFLVMRLVSTKCCRLHTFMYPILKTVSSNLAPSSGQH